jgi:RNA polymerase sigma-70 factor (ECF subfamily)
MCEERLKSLLLAGLGGDARAYRLFLADLTSFLRGFLRRRLASLPEDVEDLVQELLLAIHNQKHTYRSDQPLTAWVRAIARYKLVDLLRRRARTTLLHDSIEDDDPVFVTADGAATEASYDVEKLLGELPERQRLPIQYVKIDGDTVADVARRTGMSESAVKVGIHRGLKALAAKIQCTA